MRSPFVRSALAWLPVLAGVAFACNPTDDPSAPQDDAGTIDSGPAFDGGSPGDGGVTTPDGEAPKDAGTDGAVGAGGISVTAHYDDDSVEVGSDVYFYEDTQPVFHTKTDATGSASHAVSHPTSVTILHHRYAGAQNEIVTVMAVMPGDHVTFGREGSFPVIYSGYLNANIPGGAGYPGATMYDESIGECSGGGTTQTMLPVTSQFTALVGCGPAPIGVLMTAFDSSGILAFAEKPATPSLTSPPTITFAAGDWQAVTKHAVTFAGTPPTAWASSVGTGVRFPDTVGVDYALQGNYVSVPTDLSTLAFAYAIPPTVPAAITAQAYATGSAGLANAQSTLAYHGATNDAVAFDWSHLLPRLTNPTVSGALTTPSIGWTPDTALTNGSSGFAEITANGGDAGGTITWRIVFPVDGTSVTPPALPTDVTGFQPTGTWKLNDVNVSSGAIDYATFRQAPTSTPAKLLSKPSAPAGEQATTTVTQS